jgi:alkylation response protein AidB-like acyl-CoA dehydrogenase
VVRTFDSASHQDRSVSYRALRFPRPVLPEGAADLRAEVRAFVAGEIASSAFRPRCDNWLAGYDPDFSRRLGARGWLGMTWPKKYGGGERSALERYIVTEELLAAGAPVAAHWIADRQTGPLLLRYGTEEQRQEFLPAMTRGELFCCIGMSEPDSGSDLASIRTSARRVEGGWSVSGTKVWTSGAHRGHLMLSLVRTEPLGEDRHHGLSQLLIDLRAPGVQVRPIRLMTGEHHFNEVVLNEVHVPDAMLVGKVGDGWSQVVSELAFERSGPERFLSTFPLLQAMVAEPGLDRAVVGNLTAQLWALRRLSLGVATAIQEGRAPAIEAALVKDLGTRFEREVTEQARRLPPDRRSPEYARLLAEAELHGPGFTLRGGTNEILRGIVARGLAGRG